MFIPFLLSLFAIWVFLNSTLVRSHLFSLLEHLDYGNVFASYHSVGYSFSFRQPLHRHIWFSAYFIGLSYNCCSFFTAYVFVCYISYTAVKSNINLFCLCYALIYFMTIYNKFGLVFTWYLVARYFHIVFLHFMTWFVRVAYGWKK